MKKKQANWHVEDVQTFYVATRENGERVQVPVRARRGWVSGKLTLAERKAWFKALGLDYERWLAAHRAAKVE